MMYHIHFRMTELKNYVDAIITVKDKLNDADYTDDPREISMTSHMYSNTKKPVPRFKLNNEIVKRNNSIIIGYKCLHCSIVNHITLNLFLRKITKKIHCCDACKNLDDRKRSEHTSYMLGERVPPSKDGKWSEKSLIERIVDSKEYYAREDDDFKREYMLKHFNVDEFQRVQYTIISVGNGKIKDLTDWEYLPYYKIGNQSKYTPMLVNSKLNTIEKPLYIEWKCEVCENSFTNRDLEVQKNRLKILCADCGFSNRTFKVKSLKTPWGKITYQSQQEYRFIHWCIENDFQIENGPTIEYEWNSKHHKYKVDFMIPTYRRLVEIKDNHIWHTRQIENGKWSQKEDIAKKWCSINKYEYDLVFPKNLSLWKENIMKQKESCKI